MFAQQFPGIDGFLGTRASLMLDVVFLAMFAILPILGWSIYQVRYRRKFQIHKTTQLVLGMVLLITVTAFEIEMQFITPWEDRAEPSPYFDSDQKWSCPVGKALLVHLCFAVPTAGLWIFVIAQGLRNFPKPVGPSAYSPRHKFWGRIAAGGMLMTAITGWLFYWIAFMT